MEFGSVRFFRRIISLAVVILLLSLTVAVCVTGYRLAKSNELTESLKSELLSMQALQSEGEETPAAVQDREALSYQMLFSELYAAIPDERTTAENTVYLTFDDGPGAATAEILDILKEYEIKATFFVTGNTDDEGRALMKRIVDEGHSIGVHTYSHSYTDIYSSVDAYLDDFNNQYQLIYESTGVKPDIFRFPGGTVNKYNVTIRKELTAEMLRRGFTYYDWNASALDAKLDETVSGIVKNAVDTGADKSRIIMLMHDGAASPNIIEALPQIIDHYKDKGYDFDKITNDIQPIAFD